MKIKHSSVLVENQDIALKFYTEVLGFVKKYDMPIGEFRWITVVSPDGSSDMELVLEPNAFPPAKIYQKALFDAGVPAMVIISDDIQADYNHLTNAGVKFRSEPQDYGQGYSVLFEDTCGNLINLFQAK